MSAFKSKKLWVAVLTAALIAMNNELGLHFTPEQIAGIVTTAVGYIVGQAVVDAKKNPPA